MRHCLCTTNNFCILNEIALLAVMYKHRTKLFSTTVIVQLMIDNHWYKVLSILLQVELFLLVVDHFSFRLGFKSNNSNERNSFEIPLCNKK